MYGVRCSKDPRSGIQNGFWGIKVLIYIGLIVGAFFIPSGTFVEGDLMITYVLSIYYIVLHFNLYHLILSLVNKIARTFQAQTQCVCCPFTICQESKEGKCL